MLTKDQAFVLAKECLPQVLSSGSEEERNQVLRDVQNRTRKLQIHSICRLWAGMGHIYQVEVEDAFAFCVKHIALPSDDKLSRGDQRKALSYQVEAQFYQHVAPKLLQEEEGLILPVPYHVQMHHSLGERPHIIICMSLLKGSWIDTQQPPDWQATLAWLAHFHAAFWGRECVEKLVQDVGLQSVASYWHLDTRPDEHASMSRNGLEGRLKRAARALDECLKRDPMQCLVHGDPKEANVMKLKESDRVALYDFQYCGQGTPTRDLAYFLCSSCDEDTETEAIQYYHAILSQRLSRKGIAPPTREHLEQSLELAFCDFHRFLCGWGQWGYNLKQKVIGLLDRVDGGKDLGSEEAYREALQREFW